MVRRYVKEPVAAYKPKKVETDPAIAPILERGMRYLEEFASPDAAPLPAADDAESAA
jgi:hypothetical protein